jgi:ferredoxin
VTRLQLLPYQRVLSLDGGVRVLDALDESELGLRTACRAANCGICRVRVVSGAEALQPAAANEIATLQAIGAAQDQRLGCQLRIAIAAPDVLVVLERGS